MQFVLNNGVYKVARITGPEHNFLGIRLGGADDPLDVVPLSIKEGEQLKIEEQEVLRQVEEGLKLVNQKLDKQYYISELHFVPSDTKSTSVYIYLIQELIKRIDCGGNFSVV